MHVHVWGLNLDVTKNRYYIILREWDVTKNSEWDVMLEYNIILYYVSEMWCWNII